MKEAYRDADWRQQSQPSAPGNVTSIVLTGLTGAGKSSACLFLTNSEKCEPSHSMESHTRETRRMLI